MRSVSTGGHPEYMTLHCLLVDDNAAFMTAMRYMLERDGIEVVGAASNAADAVARAEESRPEIVVIDVRLGTESGFDVGERIAATARGAPDWKPTIVLVSTHSQDELAARFASHPSLRFLDKTTVSADKIRKLLPSA